MSSGGKLDLNFLLLDFSGDIKSNKSIKFPETEHYPQYWADSMWYDGIDFYIAGNGPLEYSSRMSVIFRLNDKNKIISNATIENRIGSENPQITGFETDLYITWWSAYQNLKLMKISSNLSNKTYVIEEELQQIPFTGFHISFPFAISIILIYSRTNIV